MMEQKTFIGLLYGAVAFREGLLELYERQTNVRWRRPEGDSTLKKKKEYVEEMGGHLSQKCKFTEVRCEREALPGPMQHSLW